jgi:hypothetical protein
LNEKTEKTIFHLPVAVYLVLAFLAGCLFTGLFFYRQRSLNMRDLDTRHVLELPSEAAQLKLWEDLQQNLTEQLPLKTRFCKALA